MKKGANRTMKMKRPLPRQRNMIDAIIKIKWEEQLDEPPIDFKKIMWEDWQPCLKVPV